MKTKQMMGMRRLIRGHEKTGFTIIEVVVAVAMVVIIASVALPILNPGRRSDLDRARNAAYELARLRDAINGFEPTRPITSFKQAVGANPRKLSDLTTRIEQTGSNSLNSCGAAYTAGEVALWTSSAPYWYAPVSTQGLTIGRGYVAQDLMLFTRANLWGNATFPDSGQVARIRMPSVSRADAENLSLVVDGSIDGTAMSKTVSFVVSGTNAIQVDYLFVVRGC